MKLERRIRKDAEVYTASLNDIMFFLLLFFLIISTMATPMAIKVLLPKAATPEKIAVKRTIKVTITKDKLFYIEDKEVAANDIGSVLAGLAGDGTGDERPNILLQIDRDVDVQTLMEVIDAGNRLELKTTVVVEKK